MTGAESGSPLNIGLCWADIPAGKAYQPATEYVYGALGGARTGVWAVDSVTLVLSIVPTDGPDTRVMWHCHLLARIG